MSPALLWSGWGLPSVILRNSTLYRIPCMRWGPDDERAEWLESLSADVAIGVLLFAYFLLIWWML